MNKRGQFVSGTLMYIIAAVVIVLTGVFGFRAMNDLQENRCETELQMFKADLTGSVAAISRNFGEREEKTYPGICDAEEIYFLDRKRALILNIPEIDSTIISGSPENVFLFGKKGLIDAFRADSFDIDAPYYECLEIKDKKLDFYLTGTGNGADIEKKHSDIGCSPVIATLAEDESISLLGEICEQKNMKPEACERKYVDTYIPDPYCHQTGNGFKIKIGKYKEYEDLSIYHIIPECVLDTLLDDYSVTPSNLEYEGPETFYLSGNSVNIAKFSFEEVDSNGMIILHYNVGDPEIVCDGDVCSEVVIFPIENSDCQPREDDEGDEDYYPYDDCLDGYSCSNGECVI
ncbi:hypothetical protein HQ529_02470 [Candidatus Woesearchaeota archaeon]|nr:hypothetical protein [Candidatus Woesearchaeota archaeon]